MKVRNKIVGVFALTMAMLPFGVARGAVDFVADGISYTKLASPANTVEVSKPVTGYYTEPTIVIPAQVVNDGTTYTVTGIGKNAFGSALKMTSVTIPEGITYISDYAFYNTGLTEIIIPATVKQVEHHAMSSNKSLKKVTINAALTEIADHCFNSCSALTDINIPNTIVKIGTYGLAQTSLREVVLPETVREIDKSAFQNSPSLKKVVFNEGLEYIGESAFEKCTSLEEVIIPGTVSRWGGGTTYTQRPFAYCSGIKRLVFNEGVTEIPASCIAVLGGSSIGNLLEIVIPSTVTKIGDDAFFNNKPWKAGAKISFYGETPLDYNDDKFVSSTMLENCTLEVPAGCEDAYRNHALWGQFKNIVERVEYVEVPEVFKNTVGEGGAYAGLSIRWGDDKALDNLTEAVRFNGKATVGKIIESALTTDPRFYALKDAEGNFAAFGFDTNGDNSAAVTVDDNALTLKSGVATATGAFEVAKGSSDFDHWQVNSADNKWKVFVNGKAADFTTPVALGDNIALEYVASDATEPTAKDYTFYLRPADEQGIWTVDEVVLNTSVDNTGYSIARLVPMIANVCGDAANLYGVKVSAEVRMTDNETASQDYSAYVPDAAKGGMMLRITANKPSEVLVLPYLSIRKDWGEGTETRKIFAQNPTKVSTVVANPVKGISLKEYGKDDIIEVDNMGVVLITPQYEPENADFASFEVAFEDEAVATFYKSIKGIVAHKAGDTKIILTVPGTDISAEYTVRVKGTDPNNKPADEFCDGMFWLNEEWFTHTSGSINYIDKDGKIYYRAYGNQNDNKAFGATSQFGTIYADKLIVMSKQAWDGGDTRPEKSGGRVVVADAKTLKYVGSIDDIGGDGRACVGVNPSKVYLGTTKGVRVMNLDDITVAESDIEGIELGRNDQMGDMVKSGKYVFATVVGSSVAVIDSETDTLVKTIPAAGVQTIAMSLDGRVWIGFASSLQPIDPETLEAGKVYEVPGKITCSSGSWRHGNLMASHSTNTLLWGSGTFYRWNLDEVENPSELTPVYTHSATIDDVKVGNPYGSPAYDPASDTYMYCSMPGFGTAAMKNYLHFINATTGEKKYQTQLSEYFWFPAMPISPDKYAPEILLEDINYPTMEEVEDEYTYEISKFIDDKDNVNRNIVVTLDEVSELADEENEEAPAVEVSLKDGILTVVPKHEGTHSFTLMAESNGRTVSKTINVSIEKTNSVSSISVVGTVYSDGRCIAFRNLNDVTFDVYTMSGQQVDTIRVNGDAVVIYPDYGSGVYILRGSNKLSAKIILK